MAGVARVGGSHKEGWLTVPEEWPGDPMGWLRFPKGWPEGEQRKCLGKDGSIKNV